MTSTTDGSITWAKVRRNTVGRDFVVGDIHGEFDKVDELLLKAKFDEEVDRLFAVGDLVDRGDQNEDVVKWIQKPWFYSIMGNHEQMLLMAALAKDEQIRERFARMHYSNGGEWFYALDQTKQQEIIDHLVELPICLEIEFDGGNVGLIHADVPGFDWKDVKKNLLEGEKSVNTALWGRDRINRQITTPVTGIKKVFVGHSPVKFSHMLGNVHYIDTGACFNDGHMTLVEISTGEVWINKY